MEFCKAFNAQTQSETGTVIPVVITVYEDRSFTFVTKTPPAAVLIRQTLRLDKGSGGFHRNKVGKLTRVRGDRRAQAPRSQRPRHRARRPASPPGPLAPCGVEVEPRLHRSCAGADLSDPRAGPDGLPR